LERSRSGTRRTNCLARSSGNVKVIFRVAMLPYSHKGMKPAISTMARVRNTGNAP
jgi:hypothetical protein